MNKEKLFEYYNGHKGEVIGAGVGLLFALSVLSLGIFRTIFVAACIIIGIYLGKKIYEDRKYLKNIADRVLRFFNI